MCDPAAPPYLAPYLQAARRHGGGFGSLLWASPHTQSLRFHAIRHLADFNGKTVADIGCGRADLLDYLRSNGATPAHYVGLEANEAVAQAAERKGHPDSLIRRADFVHDPLAMYVGADLVVCCGSLNTLSTRQCHDTIHHAYHAAAEKLIFNFLDSPSLAGETYLHWHRRDDVLKLVRCLTPLVEVKDDYLDGDCTLALTHPPGPGR